MKKKLELKIYSKLILICYRDIYVKWDDKELKLL